MGGASVEEGWEWVVLVLLVEALLAELVLLVVVLVSLVVLL